MDPKDYLTNKSFCPLPWTGFYVEPTGKVKNCVVATEKLGSVGYQDILDVMRGKDNLAIKDAMLADSKPNSCQACHRLEEGKRSFDIVSSRLYYLKALRDVPLSTYDRDRFDLRHVDVRWQNTCNFACVYCGPAWSSKWENELGQQVAKPSKERKQALKSYILDHAADLDNVYLAGGEPLLMTENEEFLERLISVNPNVALRVNTNLSKTGTKVFDLIMRFKNVHWTVSVEAMHERFEYIRWGGSWSDFNDNLNEINKTDHKISFNMLWFLLNGSHIFDTIDHFIGRGFQENTYVLGPVLGPRHLDIRNLPADALQSLEEELIKRINQKPGYLLQDGYEILLEHLRTPFVADLAKSMARISEMDQRRRVDSSKIFTELYEGRHKHG